MLIIEKAAHIMSIQDLGRSGYKRYGLPDSGPMDAWAHRGSNRLVGNPFSNACLEIGFSSCTLCVETDALLTVCGAGYRLFRNDQEIPLWMTFLVQRGDRLVLEKAYGGNWVYLAVAGGLASKSWLGSHCPYPRAGIGRLLRDGDQLPLSPLKDHTRFFAGRSMSNSERPAYTQTPVLRVMPGPQYEWFDSMSRTSFWEESFTISTRSDRMGYCLIGPKLSQIESADIISQGLALGEIQVPADGGPIVMMPDHPTTGGYTCIGTIASADLALLAQSQPVESAIRFTSVEVSEAQKALEGMIHQLNTPFHSVEDAWHQL